MTNILWTRRAKEAGLGFHYGAIKRMAYKKRELNAMTVRDYLEQKRAPKITVKVIKKSKKDKTRDK